MAEVITGLHAATIHVRDIEKARLFYRDVLGLKELLFDEKANRAVFALPHSSTLLTMHVQGPNEEGRPAGTVSGLVFSHPDPTEACREIQRRGGTVTVAPSVVETAIGSFVRGVIADPDGNEFIVSNRTD